MVHKHTAAHPGQAPLPLEAEDALAAEHAVAHPTGRLFLHSQHNLDRQAEGGRGLVGLG